MALDNQVGTASASNQEESKDQFEMCKENNGDARVNCKYIDNQGRCIFETCIFDYQETPIHVELWYFTCLICHSPDSINPKDMKAHFCKTCIGLMNEAEVLPFTCRFCGNKTVERSDWIFSRVCNDCIEQLYNPNCKNHWCGGCYC